MTNPAFIASMTRFTCHPGSCALEFGIIFFVVQPLSMITFLVVSQSHSNGQGQFQEEELVQFLRGLYVQRGRVRQPVARWVLKGTADRALSPPFSTVVTGAVYESGQCKQFMSTESVRYKYQPNGKYSHNIRDKLDHQQRGAWMVQANLTSHSSADVSCTESQNTIGFLMA